MDWAWPKTEKFETDFSKWVGVKHSVGVNSCTAALHLALVGCKIKENYEVIVPSITFVSTAMVILYCRATPVFADVEPDTLCIDPKDVESKITPHTRAIIPVHYGGHPCEMDRILAIARKKKILVIEDAAHACGAEYRGKKIGSLASKATCFSFHAVKNLAMGDGGMISTEDSALWQHLKKLRWLSITKSTWERSSKGKRYHWQYAIEDIGYKYHMNDIQATIGLVQLSKLEKANEKRRILTERYNSAFKNLGFISIPVTRPYVKNAHHNYVIKVKERDALSDYLREKGISTSVHYEPLYSYSLFKKYGKKLPVTEKIWKKILTLPLYPDLKFKEQDRVIEEIIKFGRMKNF